MPRLKNGRQPKRKKKGKKMLVAMVSKTSLRSQTAKQNKEKEDDQELQSENETVHLRPKRSKPLKRLIEEEAPKVPVRKKKSGKKTPTKANKKITKSPKVVAKSKTPKRKAKALADTVSAKRQKLQEVEEMMPEYDEMEDYDEMMDHREVEAVAVVPNSRQKAVARGKVVRQKKSRATRVASDHPAQVVIESVSEAIPKHESDDDDDVPEEDDDDIDDSLFFGIPTEKSSDFGNCSHCKEIFRREELREHMRICPEKEVHIVACRECNKVLSNLQTLERHHKRFHLKLREVPCTLCDKMFIDEAAARKHLKTVHFKVKNFHCPHCDKSFSQRNKLTYHVRTHSGEKPFSCTDCGRSFSLLWNLKTHLRTHSGEKPYACDTCGRKFTQKQNMTSHMTTHKKPKIARSNSFVTFTSTDNLDYFSMSELRQSAKATMVHSNENPLKISQIKDVQGAQYLIDHLGNITSSVPSSSVGNHGTMVTTQNNELENGLGLLSSVARKGENSQDCGSVEVDGIVDQAHLTHHVGHNTAMDQVVEVLVQPQGGNGDPSTSHGTDEDTFVSTSRMDGSMDASEAFQNAEASNMVSASAASLHQQQQAVTAQNVIPIGNANLSGLANILQNPEVLAAINAAAASNKFIVIGPVGMLSGQNAGTTNTVSIATAFSNDCILSNSAVDSEAVANFGSTDADNQGQPGQHLMQITAMDHLDPGLAASCDVEMIPADTSQDVSGQIASNDVAGNEVQSTHSSGIGVMLQRHSPVYVSSNIASDPTSSIHSYAVSTDNRYFTQEHPTPEESEVVSSQDGDTHEVLEAAGSADGEQVSSSAEKRESESAGQLNRVDSSKDKGNVQSSNVDQDTAGARSVFDVNIVSSFMTDDKLVTQSTDNSIGGNEVNSQSTDSYSTQLADSGITVSAAQTSGETFVHNADESNHSYIIKLGDQYVSSSTRTSSVVNNEYITSSVLSGTGQSMVMVTADGQSYFTTLNLPEGFEQAGNQQIILADSMTNNFNLPVLDGSIHLESINNLEAGASTENTLFSAQYQHNEADVQSGSCSAIVVEQEQDESTVTDSTARILPSSNTIVFDNTGNSTVSESHIETSVSGSNNAVADSLQSTSAIQHVGNSLDDRVDSNIDSNHDYASQVETQAGEAAYGAASSGTDFQAYQQALMDAADSSDVNYDSVVSGTENIVSGESQENEQLESQRTGVTSSNLLENNAQSLTVSGNYDQTEDDDDQGDSFVSTSLQV